MDTLKEQLVEVIKNSKSYKEGLTENEDVTLGSIDKFLNENVNESINKILSGVKNASKI